MAMSKKAKKQHHPPPKPASKRKAKTADMQQVAEYVSNLRELHKLQGALLQKLDKCLPKGSLP